jgi:hypothetical protein
MVCVYWPDEQRGYLFGSSVAAVRNHDGEGRLRRRQARQSVVPRWQAERVHSKTFSAVDNEQQVVVEAVQLLHPLLSTNAKTGRHTRGSPWNESKAERTIQSVMLGIRAVRRLFRTAVGVVMAVLLAGAFVASVAVAAAAGAGAQTGALTINAKATAEAVRRRGDSCFNNLGSIIDATWQQSAPRVVPSSTTSIPSGDRRGAEHAAIETRKEMHRFERSLLLRHVGPRLARGDYVGAWIARPDNLAARVTALRMQHQLEENAVEAGLDEVTTQLDDVERRFNEATKDMLHILQFVGTLLRHLLWGVLFSLVLEMLYRR